MRQQKYIFKKKRNRIEKSSKSSETKRQAKFAFLLLVTLLYICAGFISFSPQYVQAASATMTVETSNPAVQKGDTVYVIITIQSSSAMKGFEGFFSYDNRYLQFITGGSIIHGNDNEFHVEDTTRSESANVFKYSVKFKARKKGSTTIALKPAYQVFADDDTLSKMSLSYNALNIVVSDQTANQSQTKNEDNKQVSETSQPVTSSGKNKSLQKEVTNSKLGLSGSKLLKEVRINGVDITPAFSPNIKKYSGMITTDDSKLDIDYELEDSNAVATVSGNTNLKDGKNIIQISVKSTKGEKCTYRFTITVQRNNKKKIEKKNKVTAVEKKGKIYLTGTNSIEIIKKPDNVILPNGYKETEIEINKKKIKAYVFNRDTAYDFVLIYGKGEKAQFYIYDKDADSIMPYEKVKAWYDSMTNQNSEEVKFERELKSYRYVLAIMAVFCALLFLGFLSNMLKTHRRKQELSEEYYDLQKEFFDSEMNAENAENEENDYDYDYDENIPSEESTEQKDSFYGKRFR